MLDDVLHWFGFGLCHQLPERSFFGGGLQVPVCARDTGIYVGMVVSLALLSMLHRGSRPTDSPRWYVWAFMAASLVAMGWDGVSSYGGWRTTTNEIRLATGLVVGFSAAVIAFPLIQDILWERSDGVRVLHPVRRFLVWVSAIPLTYAFVWWVAPLAGRLYPVVVALATVGALSMVNIIIVGVFPRYDRRARRWRDLIEPFALAVVLAIVEVAVAAWVRVLLLGS